MKRLLLCVVLLGLLSGCAIPGPKGPYSELIDKDSGILETHTTCCFFEGVVHHSYLLYIDGVYTKSRTGIFYIPPGSRQLALGASLAPGKKAYAIVNLDVKPGVKYDLRVEEDNGLQMARIYIGEGVIATKQMTMHFGNESTSGNEVEAILLQKIQNLKQL